MSAPTWIEDSPVGYTVEEADGTTVVSFPDGAVKWRSDCKTCKRFGSWGHELFPSHDPLPHCPIGGSVHCTCEECF